ncbi:MAG: hypothetical protein QM676_01150 [Novosphingobium sp.]
MKVGPLFAAVPITPPGALRGGPAASFAQLLEGGAGAGTLLAQRALGFSEAGLLGVHFAQDLGDTAAIPGPEAVSGAATSEAPAGDLPRPMQAAPAPAEPPRSTLSPHGAGEAASRTDPLRSAGPATPQAALPDLPADGRATPVSDFPSAPEEAGPVRPAFADRRFARRTSPFQVGLLGKGAELTIVVDGADGGEASISNLEETARAVASEYGVAIGRVIVRTARRGARG